jgi:rRNA maturation protein Nop10
LAQYTPHGLLACDRQNRHAELGLSELCEIGGGLGEQTKYAHPAPMSPGAEYVTRACMRMAAVFISRPSAGIAESPIPGKSGAITVNRSDSRGMIGFHMRDVSA